MNPFSHTFLKKLKNRRLADFVLKWDAFQDLVIRVYREKTAAPEDAAEHARLRGWLQKEYRRWQPRLEPYWRQALLAGEPAREDPFTTLLAVPEASGFIQNWRAMQTLPAAREALNQFLLDQLGPSTQD